MTSTLKKNKKEDEEDDESFDEEIGDVRERPNGSQARFDDSSDEDEDDDDEEAAAEVCISFIGPSPAANSDFDCNLGCEGLHR